MAIPFKGFRYSCDSNRFTHLPKLPMAWIIFVFSALGVDGQSMNEPCTVGAYNMDYTNCSYYFRCESSQMWIRQACAPGTVFNIALQICDNPPGSCALVTSPPPTTKLPTTVTTSAPTSGTTSARNSSATSASISTSPLRDLVYQYLIPIVLVNQSALSQQTILITSTSLTELRIRVASFSGSMTFDSNFTLNATSSFPFHLLNKTLMNESGISDGIVDLRSRDPVNVIFFQNSGNMSQSLTTILPTSSGDIKFVVTSFSLSTVDGSTYLAYIAVVAVDNETRVFLEFPCGRVPGVTLTVNGVRLTSPRQGHVILDSLQTFLLETSSDITGTFIESTKPILVYTGTMQVNDVWTVPTKIWTFELSLPATVAGTIHVTFPSLDGSLDVYRVVAIYDGTTVQVPDRVQKDPSSGTSFLANAGDAAQLSLPSSGSFYLIQSDKPVQITKLTGDQSLNDTCTVDILPSPAWATNYTWSLQSSLAAVPGFSVKIFVIVETSGKANLRLDGRALTAVTWSSVLTGALPLALTAGYFDTDTGYHWIDQTSGTFAAYLYGSGYATKICTALGPDAAQMKNSSGINWSHSGLQEVKYGFDEFTTTRYDTTSSSENISLPNNVITTASQAVDTTHVQWRENATLCSTCWMPWFKGNLSQEQTVSHMEAFKKFLYVNPKSTSTYRRSLESIPDYRPVSNGIGVSGIVFCICAIFCVVISDLFTVWIWLYAKIRKCLH